MSQFAFRYRALNPRGGATRGVVRAASQQEAYRQLLAAGMKPMRISTARGRRRSRSRTTLRDISQFTHQLAVLMEARIPIVVGLRSIAEQEQNDRLREVIEDIARQIEGGSSVTEALSPHRDLFGEVYVETMRAAETSGNLIEVLGKLAAMLDRQHQMTKSVKSALMYPMCVIGALSLAATFLVVFVVPRFAHMFAARGLDLPLPTQVVIGLSDIMRLYWYVILGLLLAGIWGLRRAWRTPTTRRKLDSWLHAVPFLRHVLKGVAVSRFASVLGVSLRSGLSLIDALEMGGRAAGRPLLAADAEKLRDQVNVGGRLSDVIITCEYLPPFTRRMIAAGEEAGELPRMCEIISRNYDREVEHLTKNVATVIEPVLIVGLAGIVLLIALAIFLPMWNMAALIG